MNGSVLLLLPMILPFIFGLIIGFQKEEKQRNILVFIAKILCLPHQYHLADCGSVFHGIYEA